MAAVRKIIRHSERHPLPRIPDPAEVRLKLKISEPQSVLSSPLQAASSAVTGWQQSLARAIRKPQELLHRLNLPADLLNTGAQAADDFPLLVPESFLARMRPGDPQDPLLLQVLPVADELAAAPGFLLDPVGDNFARSQPGLLQKYHGRVLLMAHGSCAIHCRYCFRRHYPYDSEPKSLEAWEPAIASIEQDPSIHEIILSGGDPLLLSDNRLHKLIQRLEQIPHLRRLRVHSRLPIVLPDRVTPTLVELLKSTRMKSVMVVHANHPNELQRDCAIALEDLTSQGIPVLNQAVLLRGINDDTEVLAEFSERCLDLGVLPYYLHQLDRVRGAAHFEVPVARGRQLIEELRARLPGYAVPRYVAEVPSATSKTPLT